MPEGFLPPIPQGDGRDALFFRNLRERQLGGRDQDRPGGRTIRTTRGNAFIPNQKSASSGTRVARFRLTSLSQNDTDNFLDDFFNAVEFDGLNDIGDEVKILKQYQFRPSRSSVNVRGNYFFFDWYDLDGFHQPIDGNTVKVTMNPDDQNISKIFAVEPYYVEGALDVPSGSGGMQVFPFDLNYGGMITAVKLPPWNSTGTDNGIEWLEICPARKLIEAAAAGDLDGNAFAARADDF